jgi:predicted nucleic acid-binding protein
VLDASVCLKWFLIDEQDATPAFELRTQVRNGSTELIEPAIWRCEIASVLARKDPRGAIGMVSDFGRIDASIDTESTSLRRATELAIALEHHLFDTIYHAVAIEHGIDLVTADEHYYRKAHKLGHILLLRDWRAPSDVREEPASYRVRKSPARVRRKR